MPAVIAGPPIDSKIPEAVMRLAAGDPVEAVWLNELGGTTYRIAQDRYFKWAPVGSGLDLASEADR